MPYYPETKRKPWHTQTKQKHHRKKDMTWFYNSRAWRKFSKAYKDQMMKQQQSERYNNHLPVYSYCLCVSCLAKNKYVKATVTDHIKTFEQQPKAFDLSSLSTLLNSDKDLKEYFQPLCSSCHNKKSGREAHRKFKRGMGSNP